MDMQSLALAIEDYTRQRLSRYVEELSELCSIDSFSFHKTGLDEMALWLALRMRGLGVDATVIEREIWGNDMLSTLRGEGEGTVLLLGHMDTVYPVGTAASRTVRIEGDKLYGPGTCDMKGCILSAIYALEALLALGYHSFKEIRLLCVSDEEITSRHSLDVIERASQGSQAALILEAARSNGDIVSARKGNARYVLTAYGRSAHAGVEPEKGRNAILELAHQILQFQSINGWREGVTITAGVFTGGTLPNVVPDLAQVQFDLRYSHSQDRIDTEMQWRKLMQQQRVPGVELKLEVEPDFKEPMTSSVESLKLVHMAQDIAGLLGFDVNHAMTGGSSDGSHTTGFGVPTLDGLGPIGGLDHSPNEYLLLSSVASRTALLGGLIASLGMHDYLR